MKEFLHFNATKFDLCLSLPSDSALLPVSKFSMWFFVKSFDSLSTSASGSTNSEKGFSKDIKMVVKELVDNNSSKFISVALFPHLVLSQGGRCPEA